MDAELTDEQKKFLAECEAEFSNRYTTDDKDFIQVFSSTIKSKTALVNRHVQVKEAGIGRPPILHPWYSKNRGGGRGGGGGWNRDRNGGGGGRREWGQHRHHDGDRGSGSGYRDRGGRDRSPRD